MTCFDSESKGGKGIDIHTRLTFVTVTTSIIKKIISNTDLSLYDIFTVVLKANSTPFKSPQMIVIIQVR